MFKNLFFLAVFATAATFANAQGKMFTRDGKVYFNATSAGSPETIEAAHNSGTFVLDAATGKMEMAVLIKGFFFEKALMQEHFNENYMESSKFPKANFKGSLTNLGDVKFSTDGTYNATASGDLTIHGVTKQVSTPVVFTVKNGAVSAIANFSVVLKDYGISIPSLVADKLAKEAKISVAVDLKPM